MSDHLDDYKPPPFNLNDKVWDEIISAFGPAYPGIPEAPPVAKILEARKILEDNPMFPPDPLTDGIEERLDEEFRKFQRGLENE